MTDGTNLDRDFLIRAATVEDARDLAEVRVLAWQQAYQGLMPDEILRALDLDDETGHFRDGIARMTPERVFCVAEVNQPQSRVVGYCIGGPDREPAAGDTAEIYALYVLPGYQGRGIGRALVQAAARWMAGEGYRRMVIFVLHNNAPARGFYRAMGGAPEREKTVDIRGFAAAEVGYVYDLGGAVLEKGI